VYTFHWGTMERPELSDQWLFRVLIAIACAATALSALAVAGAAVASQPTSWYLVGFELVILMSGVIGVMSATGRFPGGPSITLLCIAGAVAVGSLLGYVGAGKILMGWSLRPLLLARMADAAFLAAASGAIVLARQPRSSIPALVKGVLLGAAMLVIAGAAWKFRGSISGAPGPVRVGMFAMVGVVAIVLLSASGHYVIRAFMFNRSPGTPAR